MKCVLNKMMVHCWHDKSNNLLGGFNAIAGTKDVVRDHGQVVVIVVIGQLLDKLHAQQFVTAVTAA
jgi:hypothetical protein